VLASLLLLALSSFACLFSERIEQLWLLRIVQGAAAGVGMILCRTIVRDLVSGMEAQKAIGQMSLVQVLIPIMTPIIGATTAAYLGWRAVFGVAAGSPSCFSSSSIGHCRKPCRRSAGPSSIRLP
jgi:MFS family permease